MNKTAHPVRNQLLQFLSGRIPIILISLIVQVVFLFLFFFRLVEWIPLMVGGSTIFTGLMLLFILSSRDDPSVKLSWCVIVALLPLFGSVLYWLIRFDVGHRLEQKAICKSIEASKPFIPQCQTAIPDRELQGLVQYLDSRNSGQLYANTQVTYYPIGEAFFDALCRQLHQAKQFIFLEYFTIGESTMWDEILAILQEKVSQGVEVRVMYDGSSEFGYLPSKYPAQLKRMGVQCKVFSPFRPFISTHYNNRDHRKIAVIDGTVAFTGGINILDRYINRRQVCGHWKDTAVMLQGDGALGFTMQFLQFWNIDEKDPAYSPYLQNRLPQQCPGYVIPYWDSPLDEERVGEMVYVDMLNRAKDYVYIMTPYLILDSTLENALTFAAKRGVDVRLLLPHIPDKATVFAMAQNHYRELTRAGVKIYEYTPGFVHAKTFLCDGKEAVVGTINLDYRSLYLHFECAAYLYGVSALEDIHADFLDTFQKSHLVTQSDIRSRPFFSRIVGALLKPIAPLM